MEYTLSRQITRIVAGHAFRRISLRIHTSKTALPFIILLSGTDGRAVIQDLQTVLDAPYRYAAVGRLICSINYPKLRQKFKV